ncbi:MAG: TldE/PmbA family protein [bacterium]|nr:TldE/PmbA family protein [bacterium]
MRDYFNDTADYIKTLLKEGEEFYCSFSGEDSHFTRLNNNKIRQPGSVLQRYMEVSLIKGSRHISGTITLGGHSETDRSRLSLLVEELRSIIDDIPEDPHFLYSQEVNSTEMIKENKLPGTEEAIDTVLSTAQGTDLVGIFASGGIFKGFANSFGQKNWYQSYSYNFDWSLYYKADKAVKCGYAGYEWETETFSAKIRDAKIQLDILKKEPVTVKPGKYRVYLSPVALLDIIGLISWKGFGLKDARTKNTCLIKMLEEGKKLHSSVTISENIKEGIAPNFQGEGFVKPGRIDLVKEGAIHESLVSPRSAKEYSIETNGADSHEFPSSLDLAAGDIEQGDILKKLGTGIYINNLWYLNFSDVPACRITGMTRFASFWVENGQIAAPLNVMRFDETLYHVLGENLLGLTSERDFLIDAGTYFEREVSSGRFPGALVEDFSFTL